MTEETMFDGTVLFAIWAGAAVILALFLKDRINGDEKAEP